MESFYARMLPIVVLYQQSLEQSLTLQSLHQNLLELDLRMPILVYDNSKKLQSTEDNFNWKSFQVFYVHDPQNSGLSKAYNLGAEKAKDLQKEWLLLLDQDTLFSTDALQKYEIAVGENAQINLFCPLLTLADGTIFSPARVKYKRGYPPKSIQSGLHNLYDYSPVNSGMLVRLTLFTGVGGYNEKIKVDFCDFQFIEKVRHLSPQFYLTDARGLQHFSNDELSLKKQQERFKIYLQDAVNCEKRSLADRLGYFYTVTRHALGLTFKLRNFSFFKLYVSQFLIRS
jgi:GT2 family glycosyltransferase